MNGFKNIELSVTQFKNYIFKGISQKSLKKRKDRDSFQVEREKKKEFNVLSILKKIKRTGDSLAFMMLCRREKYYSPNETYLTDIAFHVFCFEKVKVKSATSF